MLNAVFLKILDMTAQGSLVILAVLIIRLFLRKAPRIFSYILWSVVLFRLICPVAFEASVSVIPMRDSVCQSAALKENQISFADAGIAAYRAVESIANGGTGEQYIPVAQQDDTEKPGRVKVTLAEIAVLLTRYFWIAGVVGFCIYGVTSWLRLRQRLQGALRLRDNIYIADHIDMPFVLGLIHPRIYLPSTMETAERRYIIAHEQYHISRWDHGVKLIAFTALALHWFNPLVWLAYGLICKDMEMSCDEAVVKKLGPEIRADYAASLLKLSVGKQRFSVMPLAFGEGDTKERIENLSRWRRPGPWVLIGAGILLVAAILLLSVDPMASVNDRLSVFVDCQIAEHHQSQEAEDRACCVDWKLLGKKREDGNTVLYMWALYQEYAREDGQLSLKTSSYIPTVITVKKQMGQYKLVEYWEARDGAYNPTDIREKFPILLWGRALDSQRYIEKQQASCRKMAEDYFRADAAQDQTQPIKPGGVSVAEGFETALVYVGYAAEPSFNAAAVNALALAQSDAWHLPVYVFDTRQEMDAFTGEYGKFLSLNKSYGELPSFYGVTERYDETFYQDNTLMMVYITAASGAQRYGVDGIHFGMNQITVNVKRIKDAVVHSDDMAGWFLMIALPDSMAKNAVKFDATLDNSILQGGSIPTAQVETVGGNSMCRVEAYLPATDLSEVSDTVQNKVNSDWQSYDMLTHFQQLSSSRLFGWVTMRFDTWRQCEDALGVSIPNPFDRITWLKRTDVYGGIATDPDIRHAQMTVRATDPNKRTVEQATLQAGYCTDNVRVVISATVQNQNALYVTGFGADGMATFSQQQTAGGSGVPVLIIRSSERTDYAALEACWVDGNTYYSLHLVGQEGEDTLVHNTMQKLLKCI